MCWQLANRIRKVLKFIFGIIHYMFRQSLCSSSGVFHCTHSNGICHTGLLTAVRKPVRNIPLLCVQWKTPDDGQKNCPKHVEFYPKNKFEKLVHLTYLLTYSMVQSPSWAADWLAASQEIPRISRNPKVHYRTHKRPPPVSILGQPDPVQVSASSLFYYKKS